MVTSKSPTADKARSELVRGLSGLLGKKLPVVDQPRRGTVIVGTPETNSLIDSLKDQLKSLGKEGYLIKTVKTNGEVVTVVAGQTNVGTLYGTFCLLRLMQTHQSIDSLNVASKPDVQLRMLNHWDNLKGSIERGYAGKSLWQWQDLPDKVDPRYEDYARANASLGINGTVLNNVNASPEFLSHTTLVKAAKLADVFRPYGIKLYLSANFAAPMVLDKLKTADPLDPAVQLWWKQKADEIYRLIPDFGGLLVKADSEGQPGPQNYGRTHAQGANMLAKALAPHGGVVFWRAFVYKGSVDPDRIKRAYKVFVPLDGKFDSNVIVQSKNGPLDFQPREPFSPLFGAMPKTTLGAELQITREYLGHSMTLVYLGRCGRNSSTRTRTPKAPDRPSPAWSTEACSIGPSAPSPAWRIPVPPGTGAARTSTRPTGTRSADSRGAFPLGRADRRRVGPHDAHPEWKRSRKGDDQIHHARLVEHVRRLHDTDGADDARVLWPLPAQAAGSKGLSPRR